jgi:hypothetical protein
METARTYRIRSYDRQTDETFVRRSWCRGARQRWHRLADLLRRPDTIALCAHVEGSPDRILGCAVVAAGIVVWCYVRNLFGVTRGSGIARAMLVAAGIDLDEPVRLRVWTPHAEAIATAGKYRLVYAPFRQREETQHARAS